MHSPIDSKLSKARNKLPDENAADSVSRAEAVLLSTALSLLFIVVYGGCNALASRRTNVGICFFAWELRIPFVPALIVPYMSLDLFFVASFLVRMNAIEMRVHARRIIMAVFVAGIMFLMFPLTIGYPRPEVSGWTGRAFALLWQFDKPHNLVPSLHVALASLLWPLYSRYTRGPLRWSVHVWFTLIVASSLFTWQHHLLDVATGAMLGQFCMFAIRERPGTSLERSAAANLQVALLYAAGSAVLLSLATALGSWFWFLLWPATCLALIAIAYLRGDSAVFRKTNGQLPMSTRILLGPYLCGVFARLLIYNRRGSPWVEAVPRVYCGRLLTNSEALELRAMGVTGVLDMTAEHAEKKALRKIDYLNIPVLDLTEPSQDQLDQARAFICDHVGRGGVYVHCALGVLLRRCRCGVQFISSCTQELQE